MVTLVNRAKVNTSTVGTGIITLGSAVSGYQTFAAAGVSDGQTVRYVIEDGTSWEIGTGTYSSTGPTLTRTVIESSNANAAINLSGSAKVFLTVAAADLQRAADMDQGVATTDSPSFAGLTVDTNTLHVDAANNRVGIGTTTPSQALDVALAIKTGSGLLFGVGQSLLYSSTALQAALRIGGDGPFLVFDGVGGGGARFANSSGYLAFGTLTNEDMRITTSGRVLIDRTVDTLGGGAGYNLQVGSGAGTSGMTFHAATTSLSDIQFADGITGNESYRGMIRYDHNGDYMAFWAAAGERLRIDSSGNLRFNSGFGSVGVAYGCRAWVNFNGTGTVAIRASGNVSSITDNGTGDYTVNFTSAMPDANYAVSGISASASTDLNNLSVYRIGIRGGGDAAPVLKTTTQCRLQSGNVATGGATDIYEAMASFFR